MGDDLCRERVVGVHEAEVGLEGWGLVGGGFRGREDARGVGGEVRLDGGGQGVEGGGVGGVDGDDEAAGAAGWGRRARGCEGRGDFREQPDLAEGRDREDHGFERLGLRVEAHGAAGAGLRVLERREGEGGFGVVRGVVGARRGAHGEGGVDAGAHEVGPREGLAALAGGEGEGRCGVVDCAHGGVGSVGDTAAFGVWTSWGGLARFGTLEAR